MRVAMFGASGRMGAEVLKILQATKGATPELAISVDEDIFGWKKTLRTTEVRKEKNLKIDVCIDFSQPEALPLVIEFCKKNNCALVSGTTGLTEKQHKDLAALSKSVPVLWSSNMSLGIAVVQEMLKAFQHLTDFDFQIEEFHHNKKKDAPSGTAKTLQKTLLENVEKAPEPLSIRGGGIFGVHKIWAMSDEEVISIEHQALNRSVFAKGAVKAALWLQKQKPGIYSISKMLKLKS